MSNNKHIFYLIPGQFADGRVFQYLDLGAKIETRILEHLAVHKPENLESYAARLAEKVNPHESYSILGTSLGGIIALELSQILKPKHLILVASIKHREELPPRLKLLDKIPLYRLFSPSLFKASLFSIRKWAEPEKGNVNTLATDMLKDRDAHFLYHSLSFLTGFQNKPLPQNLLHIHGDQDTVLPYKYIKGAECIPGGAHRLLLSHPQQVQEIIQKRLTMS